MSPDSLDKHALAARILDQLTPELEAEGWDLLDVRIYQGGGRWQVRLYVDLLGADHIDLDGCAAASRTASLLLEGTDWFPGPWVLEVSSPGTRRPLRRVAHFQAAVGRNIELRWRLPTDAGRRPQHLRGRLDAVAADRLTIIPQPARDAAPDQAALAVTVPLQAVLEANLDEDVDVQALIRADRRRRKDAKRTRRGRRPVADAAATESTDLDERDGS